MWIVALTSDSVPLSGNVTGVTGLIGSSLMELIIGLDGSIVSISGSSVLFSSFISSFIGSESEVNLVSDTLVSC